MKLRQLRDLTNATQVGLAVAAVAFAGGVQWPSLLLAGALTIWAFARPRPHPPSLSAQRLWTAGVFVALVATAVRAFTQAEFLDAGVDFLLLLIVQRFFARQRSREHMQLLLLGALMMVVASVISTGIDYPLLFAAYLPTAVLALIFNHLMAEGERLGPRVALEVERQGVTARRTLMRAAAAMAFLAGLGALFIFVTFPRFGPGVFLRGNMARDMRSGFAGEVQLGEFGRIKDDPSVVMRLQPIDPVPNDDRLDWYLRGIALDHYARGRWSGGTQGEALALATVRGWSTFAQDGQALLESTRGSSPGAGTVSLQPTDARRYTDAHRTVRVLVTLEDLGVDVLFVASEPLAAKLRPRGALEGRASIRAGRHREFRLDKLPGPMRYEFISRTGTPSSSELEHVGDPESDPSLAAYLAPGEGLSPELRTLAHELTAGETTRHGKVLAVVRHLAGFTYSVDLRASERVRAGADPIEGFLFDTRAGHCEFFATAMALLLREVGVPTRIVNGYHGAHRNRLGDFWAVRQADAHSWVEVHFGPLGWVTFDPTPPAGRSAGADAPLWPAASQLLDALRHAYLEYVIDYDLGKQIALLERAGLRRGSSRRSHLGWRRLVGPLTLAALGLGVVLWLRRRRTVAPTPEVRVYQRLLRHLARDGHHRRPSESARAFAHRLVESGQPRGEPMLRFAEAYESLRFGSTSPHRLADLRRAADRVRRAR